MMGLDEVIGMPFPGEARMFGNQVLTGEDQHLLRAFVHADLFAQEAFRHRVSIGIEMDIALGIHDSVLDLGDGRDLRR